MTPTRLLPIFLLTLVGCAEVMTPYYKSVSSTAILSETCRETLSKGHADKTANIKKKADAGDPAAAQRDLDAWLPTYDNLREVCVGLKTTAKLGLAAGPTIEAATTKQKDVAEWIARLTKLALDAVKAFADAGLKLPGVN